MIDRVHALIHKEGWLIIELASADLDEVSSLDLGPSLNLIKKKKYGSSALILWEKIGEDSER